MTSTIKRTILVPKSWNFFVNFETTLREITFLRRIDIPAWHVSTKVSPPRLTWSGKMQHVFRPFVTSPASRLVSHSFYQSRKAFHCHSIRPTSPLYFHIAPMIIAPFPLLGSFHREFFVPESECKLRGEEGASDRNFNFFCLVTDWHILT